MKIFLDTSSLFKLYQQEEGTEVIEHHYIIKHLHQWTEYYKALEVTQL